MKTDRLARSVEKVARLAAEPRDLVSLWRAAADVIAKEVPHFLSPCWFTLDPASLLATSHYQAEIPVLPPEILAHEYYDEDVYSMAEVARSEQGISTLYEASGGDPSQSEAWNRFLRPYGADQELLVALRTSSGEAWGILSLYREPDQPLFSEDEKRFLHAIAPHLADGARRALLVGEASDPEGPAAPGLLVLRDDWSVESMTPGVEEWLDELPDGDWSGSQRLPTSVLTVAGRALRTSAPETPGEVAMARVLSRGGRWIVLHGASMVSGEGRRAAIILEPAHPARISSLLMSAYGLTERERDVTRLVLRGDSTADIAATLFLSTHTVQQHLKGIFEKTGVRSRRDLVGKIFFAHYEPRVRDNEQREASALPLRGGPLDGPAAS